MIFITSAEKAYCAVRAKYVTVIGVPGVCEVQTEARKIAGEGQHIASMREANEINF